MSGRSNGESDPPVKYDFGNIAALMKDEAIIPLFEGIGVLSGVLNEHLKLVPNVTISNEADVASLGRSSSEDNVQVRHFIIGRPLILNVLLDEAS